MRYKSKILILLAAFLFALNFSVFAQQAAKTEHDAGKTYQLDSKLMKRQIPYRVILPLNYNADKTARFPVIYMLHGLGGSYRNLSEGENLLDDYAKFPFIIVSPDGGSGFYTDSATKTDDKWESYIVQELIPAIDKDFRTIAERRGRAVAGLSMGGFGALKFGAKYPQMFVLAASMSGAVTAASWRKPEDLPPVPLFRQVLTAAFGDGTSPVLAENDLFKIIGDYPADKIVNLPFFYVDCGTEDNLGLLKPNQNFAALLQSRKIPHEYRELPGKHEAVYWAHQIPEILRVSERIFNQSR